METTMSLRESAAVALRTWVETCVDELAMDAKTTECMQEHRFGNMVESMQHNSVVNYMIRHGTKWENRREGKLDVIHDTESILGESGCCVNSVIANFGSQVGGTRTLT